MSTPFEQSITILYAACLETTHLFYTSILGLELVLDQGACRIYRIASEAYIGFCTHRTPAAQTGVILTLVHRDVEDVYANLVAKGLAFEVPLQHNAQFNITQAFFRDPDGYLLELQRFEDPEWPPPTPDIHSGP